jgi:hypothetical protein
MVRSDIVYYSKSDAIAKQSLAGAWPETGKNENFYYFILLPKYYPACGTVDCLATQRWCYVFTKPENKK